MSHWISYNLRHNKGITMDSSGWVSMAVLASLSPDVSRNTEQKIITDILKTVRTDKKGRFEMSEDKNNIRATNGHSVSLLSPLLRPVTPLETFDWVVHATTHTAWETIQQHGGLKKMTRDYVHFAIDLAHLRGEAQVQVYLYLNVAQLLLDGHALIITTNNVVGSVEDVPLKYLSLGDRPK